MQKIVDLMNSLNEENEDYKEAIDEIEKYIKTL